MSDSGDWGPPNQAAPGAARAAKRKRRRRYKRPDFMARWLTVILRLAVVLAAIALISDFAELSLLDRALSGENVTLEEATQNDQRQGMIALIQIVVFTFATAVFIAWTFRLYSNLEPLGAVRLRYGRGWAIGGWFLPIANLFLPKAILNDTWRASDPALEMNTTAWRDAPIPAVLTGWWIVFLMATVVSRVSLSRSIDAVELEALRNSTIAFIVVDGLLLLEFLLAIFVVKKLTARQQKRASAVSVLTAPTTSGPVTA